MMRSSRQLIIITSSMDANKKRGTGCQLFRNERHRLLWTVLFIGYFCVLFYFLFFSESMGRTYSERTYHYNLIPFYEIMRFIRYRKVLGMEAVLLNLLGNVLAFLPFGSFLPMFSKRCRKFWYTAFYSLELSLLVELIQLVTKVGSFDVDDIVLNTLGGMLGYFVYRAAVFFQKKRDAKKEKKSERQPGNEDAE